MPLRNLSRAPSGTPGLYNKPVFLNAMVFPAHGAHAHATRAPSPPLLQVAIAGGAQHNKSVLYNKSVLNNKPVFLNATVQSSQVPQGSDKATELP